MYIFVLFSFSVIYSALHYWHTPYRIIIDKTPTNTACCNFFFNLPGHLMEATSVSSHPSWLPTLYYSTTTFLQAILFSSHIYLYVVCDSVMFFNCTPHISCLSLITRNVKIKVSYTVRETQPILYRRLHFISDKLYWQILHCVMFYKLPFSSAKGVSWLLLWNGCP